MSRRILWQYGQQGSPGSGDNQLITPYSAIYSPEGNILISDQGNRRVIEVNRNRRILWQYGQQASPGTGDNELEDPMSAVYSKTGNILIADRTNHRVIEVSKN